MPIATNEGMVEAEAIVINGICGRRESCVTQAASGSTGSLRLPVEHILALAKMAGALN